VRNSGGRKVLNQAFNVDTFVPRTGIEYPLVVQGRALPPGDYRGTLRLTYGHGRKLVRTIPFSIGAKQVANLSPGNAPPRTGPSVLILILIGIVLLLLGALASAAYFKAKGRKEPLPAGGGSGEEGASG
jgi:hypothetical protein